MKRAVYLHGFASSPASRKAAFLVERLRAAGYAVDVPDLARGDFEHLTISGQLEVVERTARGEAVTVIGSSMGGYLGALYAARHPEVERVVLLAPAFGFARRWPLTLGEEKTRAWRDSGWLETFHYALDRPARVHYGLLEDGLAHEDFPAVTQPTLVLHGLRDDVVPAALSREFAATRPHVRLVLFDSGHELTDLLESLWREIAGFLGV